MTQQLTTKQKKPLFSSRARKNMRKFLRNRLAVIGLAYVVLVVLATLLAPLLTPYDAVSVNMTERLESPSLRHLCGTDKLGRDVFARLLYGGRVSIFIGFTGAFLSALIGLVLGSVAGYLGGRTDSVIIKVADTFQTFPQLILILLLVALMGQSVQNIVLVFTLTGWMNTCRIVRNEYFVQREETYVDVCHAFGMPRWHIMFGEILPNTIGPFIVAATTNISVFILSEAALSFLGFGLSTTVPSWGNLLNAAKTVETVTSYWWLWVIPGVVLSMFILAVNFFGDGLRDVLDPRQQ